MSETSLSLASLLEEIAGCKILVVGDVMYDLFVDGKVTRVSPEAPIPILKVTHEREMLGGAGNVVRNLVALGARARLVGVIGRDTKGARVKEMLGATGTAETGLIELAGRPTIVKERYIASAQQLLRVDREGETELTDKESQRIVTKARTAMKGCQAVVLSDYGKGVLSQAVTRQIIRAARQAGVPVVVDPKGQDYRAYRGASVVTPNRAELALATGLGVESTPAIVKAARHLIGQAGIAAVLATRSEAGMSLVTRGSKAVHLPAEAREVYDVSGAGDTVVAVIAAALAAGAELSHAARLANAAAGLVVAKRGTAVVTPGEIIAAKTNLSAATPLPTLLEQVTQWRAAGHKVGFTNGCFDLLHPGHVSLISQARAACDRLIVGLNSDASVKRLKGPKRPLQDVKARARVLAALAEVDRVVVFEEDTPLELIKAIHPDVLVKGADYKEANVVGAKEVKSYGGKVVLAKLEPGQSTTRTIARLKR